ncbi:phospholipase A2 [Streptomyces coryli]|uniref:phospholipase A2 n=1 Tax=Streptomyces coryli TaxID=1128680 RepID=UPI0030B87AB7
MRKAILSVIVAVSTALLIPQQSATAAPTDPQAAENEIQQPLAEGEIQQIGPGQYFTATKTFEVAESDVPVADMGRRHSIVVQSDGVARPESAPASRADLGVFGPGWEAEFLGGQLSRKLQQQSGAIVVTDLGTSESFRYNLTSSIAYPGGGGVNKYQSAEGSKITETTKWDASAGAMVTTVVETLAADLAATEPGDDAFTDGAGNPLPATDLQPTLTWKQAAPGSDQWRVTGVGNKAHGTTTAGYDAQGRVATVKEPAAGETPEQVLTVSYASATTATGTSFGDVAGRAKSITVTTDGTTQTLARYGYDSAGLLRTVTNPSESSEPDAAYAYDATNRVSEVTSPSSGEWDLAFPAGSAAPNVEPIGPAPPAAESEFQGASGITDPNVAGPPASDFTGDDVSGQESYPSYCYKARHWLYYWRSGCAAWAAHYGWHKPYWKRTPGKWWVVGINHDHCTSSPDKPSGYDFRSACDMHDYGYGLIGNTYKNYRYYLSRYKKTNVDDVFYTVLRDGTCSAYRFKSYCRGIAWIYRKGVSRGNPKNGANAT